MRKQSTLLRRFRIALGFTFLKKNARVMTCGNCNSTDIIPISNPLQEPFSNENMKADLIYVQFSKCRKCGAVCKEIQLWNNSGNVKELEPNSKE